MLHLTNYILSYVSSYGSQITYQLTSSNLYLTSYSYISTYISQLTSRKLQHIKTCNTATITPKSLTRNTIGHHHNTSSQYPKSSLLLNNNVTANEDFLRAPHDRATANRIDSPSLTRLPDLRKCSMQSHVSSKYNYILTSTS